MKENALLLITVGPVSQFIEPSRKMRDLYAGSYLLSSLSKFILEEINSSPLFDKVNTVFPMENQASIPNRVVAKIQNCTEKELVEIGQSLEEATREKWLSLTARIFKQSKVEMTANMKRQLIHMLEIHWVIEPYTDYTEGYQNILKKMHQMKNTRTFNQLYEPAARKCDLYPMYNALIVKEKENGELSRYAIADEHVPFTNTSFDLKPGEGLSAIAYVKRMLHKVDDLPNYDVEFHSVAHMLLLNQLDSSYHSQLSKLEDNASEIIFNLKNNVSVTDVYSQQSEKIAREVVKQLPKVSLSPYYAIIKLDGDDIGQVYTRRSDKKTHSDLSRKIAGFSNEAKKIIEKYDGMCIFAGGEDILAFLPISTAFAALKEIRLTFPKTLSSLSSADQEFTLSAGIVIAHLMTPLKPLLRRVEELEAYAKAIDDQKDAFAIELIHRGGKSSPFRSKFGNECNNIRSLETIIENLTGKEYSMSFIHHLIMSLQRIEQVDEELLENMVCVLIQQAIKQAMPMLEKEEQAERLAQIMLLYGTNTLDPVKHLIDQLKLVAFIVKEEVTLCITK